jgi:hypothetical protein
MIDLLEKIIVVQIGKRISIFYGAHRSMMVLKITSYLILYKAR